MVARGLPLPARAPLGLAACAVRRRLPLYSYMEDLDFAGYRRQACCHNARLVHLYTRGGRLAGSCIGFAQVMNPSYLWLKGTCPTGFLLRRVARHVAANIVKLLARAGRRLTGAHGFPATLWPWALFFGDTSRPKT
jgi:hypothetical protein